MRKSIAAAVIFSAAVFAQRPQKPAGVKNPYSGDEKAVAEGREVYNHVCTACHGYDGQSGEMAPALGASGHRYLRTTDQEIFDAIRSGIPGTAMPKTGLDEPTAWKVAAYIRSLRGTAIDAPAPGNAAHGEEIYNREHCSTCHMIRGKGGLVGPDLTDIAGRRKLYAIRDALTKPEHIVITDGGSHELHLAPMDTYKAVHVVTKDGKTIAGVLLNEDNYSVQMLGTDNQLHLFTRAELREVDEDAKSLMPTDYDKRLSKDEFQDLMAFLTRLGTHE